MTKSNKIGYVAAFTTPEVVRGINAFTLGVRTVNPQATVHVVWTNTWFGPQQEREAADALLADGADVIAQHQDTTEPQKAAAEKGLYSIGYDSDMRKTVGDSRIDQPGLELGPVLHQPCQGHPGRHLEVRRVLGRHEGRHRWSGRSEPEGPNRREDDGRAVPDQDPER